MFFRTRNIWLIPFLFSDLGRDLGAIIFHRRDGSVEWPECNQGLGNRTIMSIWQKQSYVYVSSFLVNTERWIDSLSYAGYLGLKYLLYKIILKSKVFSVCKRRAREIIINVFCLNLFWIIWEKHETLKWNSFKIK